MRSWLNIMVRIVAACMLLIGGVQAGTACAKANLAPVHHVASATMEHVQVGHMADLRPVVGHPSGGPACSQGCLFWFAEPFVAPQSVGVSTIAVLRPADAEQPASLWPDMAERPPKPLV